KSAEPQPDVSERKFMDIDIDNFDERMKSIQPRAAFQVPNTLTGEGNLNVDVTFESIDDFSPATVARKVGALNELLEARTQLANLLTYMDGKAGAEELIGKVLKNPALMNNLAAAPNPDAASKGDDASPVADESEAETAEKSTITEIAMTAVAKRADARTTETLEADGLSALLKKEFKPKTEQAREAVEHAVRTLAHQALENSGVAVSSDAYRTIQAIIAEIDRKLSEQINLVLHHPEFQQLEGAWRGLHYLVTNTETDEL